MFSSSESSSPSAIFIHRNYNYQCYSQEQHNNNFQQSIYMKSSWLWLLAGKSLQFFSAITKNNQ